MDKIIHLSLTRKSPVLMDIVQSSVEPAIQFILDDYTPESGSTARIYIKKDGGEVYNNCTLTGNIVKYTPTAGSFDVPGKCTAQIQIMKGSKVAVTYRIFVMVEPNEIEGSAAPASTEYDALTAMVIEARGVIDELENYDGIVGANNITGFNNRQGWIALTNGQDLNDITTPGIYTATDAVSSTLLNTPQPGRQSGFVMVVSLAQNTNTNVAQELKYVTKLDAAKTYRRTAYTTGGYGDWTFTVINADNNEIMLYEAKNHLCNITGSITINGLTFTVNADGSITVNGTATANTEYYITRRGSGRTILYPGSYRLSGCPQGGSNTTYRIGFNRGSSAATIGYEYGDGTSFINPETLDYGVWITIFNGYTANNLIFYPMICATSLNNTYVPYGMSNAELTSLVLANNITGVNSRQGWIAIPENEDLNNYTTPGIYYVSLNTTAQTIVNNPFKNSAFYLVVGRTVGNNYITQDCYAYSSGVSLNEGLPNHLFRTTDSGGNWFPWQGVPTRAEVNAIANRGGKNLCQFLENTRTINGVTFTVDKINNTITANGTATANAIFYIDKQYHNRYATNDSYTLTGCPQGASGSTYSLKVYRTGGNTTATDIGNGATFVGNPSYDYVTAIIVLSGSTVNNAVFRPMVRYTSIQDDTYVPYGMSNAELTKSIKGRKGVVNGTTTANGTINLGLTSIHEIIGVDTGIGDKIAIPILYNNNWYAKLYKDSSPFNVLINTDVTLTVYYRTVYYREY